MSISDNWDPIDVSSSPDVFTVLLIDDSAFSRAQVKEILKNEPIRLLEAVDGEDAWSVCERYADIKLVLCDINMPNLDGNGFLERLSVKHGGALPMPVIMLTSENRLDKVLQSKRLGAVGFLAKPPIANDLLDALHSHMPKDEYLKVG